jgi:hypothetical protein
MDTEDRHQGEGERDPAAKMIEVAKRVPSLLQGSGIERAEEGTQKKEEIQEPRGPVEGLFFLPDPQDDAVSIALEMVGIAKGG